MSLITRRRRALFIAIPTLLSVAHAQTCYYPDGKSISTDIPCNPDAPQSACCGSDEFCLADGLCYGGGLVTRGSCTDQSWGGACAQYCTADDTDTSVVITPCTSSQTSNTFACGLNATACSSSNTFALSTDTSLVLRPAQIATLLNNSLQSSSATTSTVTAVPSGYYTGGAMAGLAIGIAIPLLIALGILYMLLRKERNKFGHTSTNKNLMYKLPDDLAEDFSKPPLPPPAITTSHASAHGNSFASDRSSRASATNSFAGSAAASSVAPSRRASKWTIQTASSRPVLSRDFPPNQSQTFLERYETMKMRAAQVQSQEVTISVASVPGTPALGTPGPGTPVAGTQPQELDSTPTAEGPRYELSDTRMSR